MFIFETKQYECPSGLLNKKEFIQIYKDQAGGDGKKADKFCQQVFNTFDADKSGKIDFVEYVMSVRAAQSQDPKQVLRLAFKMYDIDRNGTIEKKEMIKLLNIIYDFKGINDRKGDNDPKKRTEAVFARVDRNKSGKLSEEEFIYGCTSDSLLYQVLCNV
jgi:Ca2+-binding EF-hand superfamily protein